MVIPFSLALLVQADPSEARQFDFWIGEWQCIGKMRQGPDKWQETRGRNVVRKILGGKIVEENFSMPGLTGRSVTAYNPTQKRWFQTWVDDGGAYIALSGGMEGKEMILASTPAPKRPGAFARMVFSNISRNGFLWRWEKTKDAGKSWTLDWELQYTRVKPAPTKESPLTVPGHFGLPLV